MTGGSAARWNDETMAATFTSKACEFIEARKDGPFLLYFTPSDIHVPRAPAEQFAGKSQCGIRCDVITQLDWSVGRVLETLVKCGVAENTLVIFTSDNGPVVNDGYNDDSLEMLGVHKPAGPFRGGKYSIYEGGTRVPFITHWRGRISPGVSDALISQLDLLRSLAAIAEERVPQGGAADSLNELPALLGKTTSARKTLVEEAEVLAIREGRWKLIDRSQRPGAHPPPPAPPVTDQRIIARQKRIERQHTPWTRATPSAPLELYDLTSDPGETNNLVALHPDIVDLMRNH